MQQLVKSCCFDLLSNLDDNYVSMIIADIPYFEIISEDWDNQWKNFDTYLSWLDNLFAEFARVLKDNSACYVYSSITHYPHVQLILNKHLSYSSTITWKKQRGRGNGWGFNREEICVNVKGDHRFDKVESQTLMLPHLRKGKKDYSNGKQIERKRDYKLASSVWDDISQVCSYRKQLHPTEKPVECARRMLAASSKEDDLILIPFAGSGSELEACVRMNRSFIASEINEKYYHIALDRVKQIKEQIEDTEQQNIKEE